MMEGDESPFNVAQGFLNRKIAALVQQSERRDDNSLDTRAKLLSANVSGSVAYGLADATSDIDYVGVYLIPTKELLSSFAFNHQGAGVG